MQSKDLHCRLYPPVVMMYDILSIKVWPMRGGLVPVQPQSRPQLRDLLRVIAIGQSQEHEGLKITALALELYSDGSLLTILLQRAQPFPMPAYHYARLGQVGVTLKDDRGSVYSGQLHEHSGSSSQDFWEGRCQCAFTPILATEARTLQIEISAIHWIYMEETDQGILHKESGDVTTGPWVFSVQVPAT